MGQRSEVRTHKYINFGSGIVSEAKYTPPTRLNSTVESRRRRRCILGLRCCKSRIIDLVDAEESVVDLRYFVAGRRIVGSDEFKFELQSTVR